MGRSERVRREGMREGEGGGDGEAKWCCCCTYLCGRLLLLLLCLLLGRYRLVSDRIVACDRTHTGPVEDVRVCGV